MSLLLSHWSFDPFLIAVAGFVAWHETGLRRLARRARPERTRQRRVRSLICYSGLGLLLIAVESPVDYWADSYFYLIQHLLLSFAAPSLLVAGAPWQPLLDGLPARAGQRATRLAARHGRGPAVRRVVTAAAWPWTAVITFSAVMLLWHVPALYDLAAGHPAVHIYLMHGSLFLTGVLFWLQFIPSPPFRVRLRPTAQVAALAATNVVMWLLAMSMSILASRSWYPVYAHVPGVTLPPFADQQIGAAILWVCGDFWCYPAVVIALRRMIAQDGSVTEAVDRILRPPGAGRPWATRGPAPTAPQGPRQEAR
jgi:cytochrome c oxidase assembly factor CtaG